jgi:uncharacterized protein with NAD-binding domain and iron-sulfur cluster
MGGDGPIRVAILGGGAGAMAAAFALTATAEQRRKYRLTVYQQGWRLGGKGASGRNAAAGQRIEEHGLHIWLGFYENAFRLMRDCYAEWQAPAASPVRGFDDAFRPLDSLTVIDRLGDENDGPWDFWNVEFPRYPGSPGVDPSPYAISHWLERLVAWLGDRLAELIDHHRAAGAGRHPWLERLEGASHPAFTALDRLIREAGSDLVAAADSRGRLLDHVERCSSR